MKEEEERRPAGGNMRYERCGKGFSEFRGGSNKRRIQKAKNAKCKTIMFRFS